MLKLLRTLPAHALAGKTCILRADLNIIPEDENDSFRLNATLPTLHHLLNVEARIILISHRGRPLETPRTQKSKYSLKPFMGIFERELGAPVAFFPDSNLARVKTQLDHYWKKQQGRIALIENLRLHPGEEANDPGFARKLAALGDTYVNDAFAVSHRKNASVCAITRPLPAYAGLLLEKEVTHLDAAMRSHQKPFTLVVGGAKISDKASIIAHFAEKADHILTGGGVANTLLKAKGTDIGSSLHEKDFRTAPLLKIAHLETPSDWRAEKGKILDIGPETEARYAAIIKQSKTIIWSGPMGVFEKTKFASGTIAVWHAILENKTAQILVGGGETISAYKLLATRYKIPPNVFLSTGGGAMLEYLSGKKLPGIEALGKY